MGLQPVTHNGPFSFREVSRRKRCFTTRDSEKERRYSTSTIRVKVGNPREGTSSSGVLNNYYAGTKRFKTACKQSVDFASHSGNVSSSSNAKNNQQHVKRPYDRFVRDPFTLQKADAPVVKKHKIVKNKPTVFHSCSLQNGPKTNLNDVKWMYRNQHANMSGPYALKQLMEGLQARFLPEELLIYEQGKLSKPIKLKQLIDDLRGSSEESMHNLEPQSTFSSQHTPTVNKQHLQPKTPTRYTNIQNGANVSGNFKGHPQHLAMPSSQYSSRPYPIPLVPEGLPRKAAEDVDLPPGFGGPDSQLASCTYMWNSTSDAVNASLFDCESADMVPPGFEILAVTGALPGLHAPVGSFTHSNLSFSTQGTKVLSRESTELSTWAYAPMNVWGLQMDVQTFPAPRVCIGLPVCKPPDEYFPLASNLLGAVETELASCLSSEQSMTAVQCMLTSKEYMECTDPLEFVQRELCTAVKRSYASSVLSAHVGEQLDYLLASKKVMGKVLLAENWCTLSQAGSTEDGITYTEIEVSETKPSIESIPQAGGALGLEDGFLQGINDRLLYASFMKSYLEQLEEQEVCLPGASTSRNMGSACSSLVLMGLSSPNGVEDNKLEANKIFSYIGKTDDMRHEVEKLESCVVNGEAYSKSSSPFNNCYDECKKVSSVSEEEMQLNLADEVQPNDALAEPTCIKPYKKRGNIKSLKQLMLITSKSKPKQTKHSLAIKEKKRELSRVKDMEVFDWMKLKVLPHFKDYDGCARTSIDGCEWHNVVRHDHSTQSFKSTDFGLGPNSAGSMLGIQSNMETVRTTRLHLRKLAAAAPECTEILNFSQFKVQKKKIKFARSKIHGWGLFAIEPFEAGDFVIEYIGELMRQRISDIRKRHYEKMGIGISYLFHIDNETVVDATKRGGLARFINHSCDPNCVTKIITKEGSKKIFICAKRQIRVGEELTYDYKFPHEKQEIPCHCGSTGCRGTLIS